MKFVFAFEKLLDHKSTLEDIARRDYMAAQALVDAANRELHGMYDQITSSRERGARLEAEGGAQGPALVQISDFIRGQKIRIDHQRAKIRELVAEAERLHEILIEAAREKKTLEKLKERRFEDYKKLRKKMELKQVDELVVTRFKRAAEE